MWAQTKTAWIASRPRARGDVREVALLAYPVVLQTLAETAMQVIDSAMVGRLGAAELGAVGLAGIWIWTAFVPLAGTANGVQVFVARHFGAEEHAQCGPVVWRALWLVLPAMASWLLALGALLPWLLGHVAPSAELAHAAVGYSYGRLPGGLSVVANMALTSFFRGIGDTRTPLLASLCGVAVNVPLAYALIFGALGAPALGAAGAGVAVSAGSFTMCGVLLWALCRRPLRERYRTSPRAPTRGELRRYLATSAPIGGQWLLDMVSFALFTSIVARMGDASMAASQAMLQLLSLSFMQAVAISIAASSLVGRYLGAGDPDGAARSYRSAQLLALGVSLFVGALFVAIPAELIGIFGDDPGMVERARPLLLLGALFQLVDAAAIVASGALRGAGDTRWPFAVQASLAWLLRLPVVYAFAVLLGGGVLGAWLGELVYVAAIAGAFVRRFAAGAWRDARM